jgi:hypothetical protein
MTFGQYVNQFRVEKAVDALINTNDTITEIVFKSGFNSAKTFNRVFRQLKGCSPSAYKRTLGTDWVRPHDTDWGQTPWHTDRGQTRGGNHVPTICETPGQKDIEDLLAYCFADMRPDLDAAVPRRPRARRRRDGRQLRAREETCMGAAQGGGRRENQPARADCATHHPF